MRVAIDQAGRLVIPRKLREQAGLRPDQPLEIEYSEGAVHIRPAPAPVRLERRGGFLVAVPEVPLPPLTAGAVEAARERLDEERT